MNCTCGQKKLMYWEVCSTTAQLKESFVQLLLKHSKKGASGLEAQLCCSVLDSIGGAESYSVSVSWVGSPANVQGFDNVPAPQSQKNLWDRKREREESVTSVTSETVRW